MPVVEDGARSSQLHKHPVVEEGARSFQLHKPPDSGPRRGKTDPSTPTSTPLSPTRPPECNRGHLTPCSTNGGRQAVGATFFS